MIVLAAIPSSSVALVIVRGATKGTAHGMSVAAGIVAGDLLFIVLAILGLNAIAENMAGLFLVIKYVGAVYLIYLGITLIRSQPRLLTSNPNALDDKCLSSFIAGFLLTLGDLKAIIFYVIFFPSFLDLENLRAVDVTSVIAITVITVGGVKACYAVLAARLTHSKGRSRLNRPIQIAADSCMIGAGTSLLIKQ